MRKYSTKLMAMILSIVMVLSLIVVPASAARPMGGGEVAETPVAAGTPAVRVAKDATAQLADDPADPVTSWSFDDVTFTGTPSDFKGLTMTNVTAHNSKYAHMGSSSSIVIPATAPCAVVVGCEYGNNGKIGVGDDTVDLVGENSAGVTYTTYFYGGEGELKITRNSSGSADLYLTSIEMKTSVWDFGAADFTDAKYATSTPDEYNGLTFSQDNKASKESGGASKPHVVLKPDGVITVPVPGKCDVNIYTYYSGSAVATVAAGSASKDLEGSGASSITAATYHHTGEEKSVTITGKTGTYYVGKITLTALSVTPPSMDLGAKVVVMEKGGDDVVLTPAFEDLPDGVTDPEVSVEVADGGADIVTAEVPATGENAGKVVLSAGTKGGDTTVTVTADMGTGNDDVVVELPVRVIDPSNPPTAWDFSDAFFQGVTKTDTEFCGLTLDGIQAHNSKYAYFNTDAKITVPTSGPCIVQVDCEYGNAGTVGVTGKEIDLEGDNDKGIDTTFYFHDGQGDVVITKTGSNVYLTGIKVHPCVWTFPQAEIAAAVSTNAYKGLKLTSVTAENQAGKDHAVLGNGSKIEIPVPGKCDVSVTCYYGAVGTVGTTELETASTSDGATATYHYTGEAGYVAINTTGTTYVKKIEITPYTDPAPAIELSAEKAELELGDTEPVKITATLKNATADGAMTAAVADGGADIVTAAMGTGEDAGKVILTVGTKAGETTVTVSTKVTGSDDPVTATIAVKVTDPDVTPTVWDLRVDKAADLESAMKGLKIESIGVDGEGNPKKAIQHHGSTYGVYFYIDGQIWIPVDGPSTVHVWGGYDWHFSLGDPYDYTRYGTRTGHESDGNKVKEETFTFTGGKGYAVLTSDGTATSYVAKIEVEPLDIEANNVMVWDFGLAEMDTTIFTNMFNVDNVTAIYPEGTAKGAGAHPASFETAGIFFTDGGYPTSHRWRLDSKNPNSVDKTIPFWDNQGGKMTVVGGDPYEPNAKTLADGKVKGGKTYSGHLYSNSGGNTAVTVGVDCEAGDKLTFITSSNGGAATYGFFDAANTLLDSGEFANVGDANAVAMTFYAPADGKHHVAVTNNEKLVIPRVYRETGVTVTVTGAVDQSLATGISDDYSVVFTGPGGVEYKAPVQNGKYEIEIKNYLSGADYVLSLEGADEYIVATGEELSLQITDRAVEHNIAVASVTLVKISGKIVGLGEDDLANLKLTVEKPDTNASGEPVIYQPKIQFAEDGTFSTTFEKDITYTLVADNVNDYTLAKSEYTFTAAGTQNIVFTAKPTYAITMKSNPDGVDMAKESVTITFTNKESDDAHKDGYVYTFKGTDTIKLRDGQYTVKVEGVDAVQKLTPDLKVAGAANDCTVPFLVGAVTDWVFSDADCDVEPFTNSAGEKEYNTLKIGDKVRKESGKGHLQATGSESAPSKVQVPVTGPCDVAVTIYYAAAGTVGVGNDTVELKCTTSANTTGATDVITYTYTGTEAGYVDVTMTGTTYITEIHVITKTEYAATLQVGPTRTYKTINEALAAVRKMDRKDTDNSIKRVTIEIDPGNYQEMLRIDTPNVTLKNADEDAALELKNKGVDIGVHEVRITHYYGHGYAYYSMDKDCTYNADLLAVNKANGKLSFSNPGTGTTSGSYWNATVRIMASGVQAEGIIFENSFNQYQSELAANDVIIKLDSAKEGTLPRADMKAGDTTVQHKEYVERAAALAINNNCDKIYFENCKFISRQDTLYGGSGTTAGFKDCAVYGGTDYIFGPMNAVFAQCDLVFNTNDETAKGQKDDVGYVTAPQQSSGRGYLMWNCHITSTTPGVDTASVKVSKPGTFGRPWQAGTGEAVFYKTYIDATDPSYFGDDVTSYSMIQPAGWLDSLSGRSALCGDYDTTDYYVGSTTAPANRASWTAKFAKDETADGAKFDYKTWMGDWNPFGDLTAKVWFTQVDPTDTTALKDELAAAITAAQEMHDAVTTTNNDEPADVARGEEYYQDADKTALADAIADATTVKDNASATADEILAAKKDLADAVTAFQNAKKVGTKAPTTTALETAITAAEDAMDGVVISAGPATAVDKDVVFVPQDKQDALDAALAAANAVKDSATATQDDIDDATTALTDATGAYTAAKGTGTKAADKTALAKAITDANALKGTEGLTVGAAGEDKTADELEPGKKFVKKTVADALDAAITAAEAANTKADATQPEIDEAKTALDVAMMDFEAAIQTGTTTEEAKAELDAVVAAAESAAAAVTAGNATAEDADTLAPGSKVAPQDKIDAVATAVADAKALAANATKAEVVAAKEAVAAAKAALDKATVTGSDTTEAKTALATALADAKETVAGLTASSETDADKIAPGTTVAPEAQINAVNSAIAAAEALADNATKKAVDDAKKAVDDAVAALSVVTGTDTAEAKSALADAVSTAKTASADVAAHDGEASEIYTGKYFVPTETKQALDDAIEAAEALDGNATKAEIDEAKQALADAKAAFDEALTEGTKKRSNGSGPAFGTGTKPTENGTTTTETAKNPNGDTVTTVTDPNGDQTITVTDENGEVLAEVSLPATNAGGKVKFIDVPEDHWAAKSIDNMAGLGMVKGISDDTFDMYSAMTRGSVATMFYRLAGEKAIGENTYADVSEGDWYADGVAWATKAGVVNGYSADAFGPNDTITRQQLAVMATRFAKLLGIDVSKANDSVLGRFTDGDQVDAWAVEGMSWCISAGIFQGRGDGTVDPTAEITRAEAAVVFDRLVALIQK